MKLGFASADTDEVSPVVLPVTGAVEISRDLAAAPIVEWFRRLAVWAADGQDVGVGDPLKPVNAVPELDPLVGFPVGGEQNQTRLANASIRWAQQASLLRLRKGVLRTAKQNVGWLDDPAVLWFRAVCALERPTATFADALAGYSGGRWIYGSLNGHVGDLMEHLADGPLDAGELLAAHCAGYGHYGNAEGDARTLIVVAQALGLIAADPIADDSTMTPRWTVTGLGRVFSVLHQLPYRTIADEDDETAAFCLIEQPEEQPEPGLVVKVELSDHKVWRRLRIPGELTVYGLHRAIEDSFGWDGDHLHVFHAGPINLAAAYFRLDASVPSEFVTMTDLVALGIRDFRYRYDLGDCWDHQITIEKTLPGGEVSVVECVAGAGTTPAEDGQDWYEDDDGEMVHNPQPLESHVYDPVRINRALASLTQ